MEAGLTLKWKNGMVDGLILISCFYEFCIIESVPEPVTWVHCSALTALFLYASMRGVQKKVLELVTRNDDSCW